MRLLFWSLTPWSSSFPQACSGDIYASVPIATPGLVRTSSRGTGGCQLGYQTHLVHEFGKTEVQNLRLASLRHKDVCWLNVAVDDSLGVRGIEGVGNLDGQLSRVSSFSGLPAMRCRSV